MANRYFKQATLTFLETLSRNNNRAWFQDNKQRYEDQVRTPAHVLIAFFSKTAMHTYLRLAAQLRAAGLSVEFYPDPKRLGQQLKYADQRGFRVALIAGDDELARGTCQVKDLGTGTSREVPLEPQAEPVVDAIRKVLE